MKNNWSLTVIGVGALDAAMGMLTNFVSDLRSKGLTITDVRCVEGDLHPDLVGNVENSEDGWTLYVYGTGDVSAAYNSFPDFLAEFEKQGDINVLHSAINTGTLREIPIPA